jgi:hypothetical protein
MVRIAREVRRLRAKRRAATVGPAGGGVRPITTEPSPSSPPQLLERTGITADGRELFFSNDLGAGVQLGGELVQRLAPATRHGPGHALAHAP